MQRSRFRILVAEDNATNLEVCRHFLQKAGVQLVETAENGVAVLRLLGDEPTAFDLILMDVRMPEKDGIETTKEIISRWPSPKARPRIVALTAHAFVEETRRCLDAGMDACLSKPLRAGDLETVIDQLLLAGSEEGEVKTVEDEGSEPRMDLVDWKQFDMIVDAPDSPCVGILADFIASIPPAMSDLQQAAGAGDSSRVADIGHQFKGSANSFGFVAFGKNMLEAEKAGRTDGEWLETFSGDDWREKCLALLQETVATVVRERGIQL